MTHLQVFLIVSNKKVNLVSPAFKYAIIHKIEVFLVFKAKNHGKKRRENEVLRTDMIIIEIGKSNTQKLYLLQFSLSLN